MSYVVVVPEFVVSAASDLSNIGSGLSEAMRRRRPGHRGCRRRPG